MQTEGMERLLRKGSDSLSGWRISGYLLTLSYPVPAYNISGVYFSETLKPYKTVGELLDNWKRVDKLFEPISFDAFEQGIKTPDGTWWFAGDRFKMHSYYTLGHREHITGFIGILVHEDYNWIIKEENVNHSEEEGCKIYIQSNGAEKFKPERIGTIHEEN